MAWLGLRLCRGLVAGRNWWGKHNFLLYCVALWDWFLRSWRLLFRRCHHPHVGQISDPTRLIESTVDPLLCDGELEKLFHQVHQGKIKFFLV